MRQDKCFKPWIFFVMFVAILFVSLCFIVGPIIAEKNYVFALRSFHNGKLEEAMRFINQAKIFMPIDPKFYELSGEIKANQGLIDEAIEYYKKALCLKQDFAYYHTRMGQLYLQQKKYAYALLEFEEAIDLDKYGVCYQEHYSDLGDLYKELGEGSVYLDKILNEVGNYKMKRQYLKEWNILKQ